MDSHHGEAGLHQDMVSLILKELRDFHQDSKTQLEYIKEEITKTNTRLDKAEEKIVKAKGFKMQKI